jgi:hypothetical protein
MEYLIHKETEVLVDQRRDGQTCFRSGIDQHDQNCVVDDDDNDDDDDDDDKSFSNGRFRTTVRKVTPKSGTTILDLTGGQIDCDQHFPGSVWSRS